MGSGNRVIGNRFVNLNLAGCNESAKQFPCIYKADEPEMLESGIYLEPGVGSSGGDARKRHSRTTRSSGHGMKSRCIVFGPGVSTYVEHRWRATLAPTSRARPVTYPDS